MPESSTLKVFSPSTTFGLKKYREFPIDAWRQTMHHHPEAVQSYLGALRPGSGTFPTGRLSRRDKGHWRWRRAVAAASTMAFALSLVLSGPGHVFLIIAALSMIAVLGYTLAAEQQLHATSQAVARVARHLDPGDDPRGA